MGKQTVPCVVKLVRSSDRERLPALVDRVSELPDFDATLWVVGALPGKNLASETISRVPQSLLGYISLSKPPRLTRASVSVQGIFIPPAKMVAISKACRVTVLASVKALNETVALDNQKANK